MSKCRLRLPVAAQSWQDSREALVTTSSLFRHDSDLALDLLQFESRRRNRELPDKSHLKANSKYGVFTILGRAAQLGCLVFGTSMVACMYNASALFPGALSAVVLTYVVLESSSQKGDFSWYPQTPYNLPLSALVCLTTAYSFQHPRPAIST